MLIGSCARLRRPSRAPKTAPPRAPPQAVRGPGTARTGAHPPAGCWPFRGGHPGPGDCPPADARPPRLIHRPADGPLMLVRPPADDPPDAHDAQPSACREGSADAHPAHALAAPRPPRPRRQHARQCSSMPRPPAPAPHLRSTPARSSRPLPARAPSRASSSSSSSSS